MQYPINEVLTEDTGYFVFQLPDVVKNPKEITRYSDDVISDDAYASLKRELSYSFDGSNWSNWQPLSSSLLKSDQILQKGDISMRFRITRNLSNQPVTIVSIDFDYVATPADECEPAIISKYMGLEFCNDAEFDPYKISAQASELETALNGYINKSLGMTVQYFHVKPDQDNTDSILNEYSTFKESGVGGKCIKIMVPENALPDPSLLHNEWGIDFEKFEVNVSMPYFETVWGHGEEPRQEDIIYFPKFNRIFYVSSVKGVRGTDGIGQFYAMNLKRYDKNTAIKMSNESQELLDELTKGSSHDENFREVNLNEGNDITNEMQNEIKTIALDNLRSYIDPSISILDEQIINNGTPITNHVYQLIDGAPGKLGVTYKPDILLGEDFALTFWMKRKNPIQVDESDQIYYRNFMNYLPFSISNAKRLDLKRVQITVDKPIKQTGIYQNCFIQTGSDIFYVIQVIDDFTMIINTPNVVAETSYRVATCEILPSTYQQMQGVFFAFVSGRYIYMIIGNSHFKVDTSLSAITDDWLAFVINFSSTFSFIETYVYSIDNKFPAYPQKYSTTLKKLSKQSVNIMSAIVGYQGSTQHPLYLSFSRSKMTNIRLWREPIEEELHSLILNQPQVAAVHKTFVIDNADPVYRYDKLGRGIGRYYDSKPDVNPEN